MNSLKSKTSLILTFVFTIIIALAIFSMLLVYQLGTTPRVATENNSETIENPLALAKSFFDMKTLSIDNIPANADSVDIDTLYNQFDAISKVFEKNIRSLEDVTQSPASLEKIDSLKKEHTEYQQHYKSLRDQGLADARETIAKLRQQFNKMDSGVTNLYSDNWQQLFSHGFQQTDSTYSVFTIFLFTGISLLLMLGAGVYSAKAVGRSERKLSDVLEARNEEKRQFIANISHELKTSASAINLGTKILNNKKSGKLNKDQQELIQSIQDQTKRLLKIVNETKEFSKKR